MATAYQLGKWARANGVPAETAVYEAMASEPRAVLTVAVSSFLDGFGVKQNPARGVLFKRCVEAVSKRGGARDPRAVCAAAGRRKLGQAEMTRRSVAGRRAAAGGRRKNPAEAAAVAFEEFNGHKPTKVITVRRKVHFHEWLAGAGKLVQMSVDGVDNRPHLIEKLGGALLAFNEEMNQLFVEGGDQSINLRDYKITEPHELEVLGQITDIDYDGDKSHLGREGGKATYRHIFRTTNERGEHVVVKVARYPILLYRVRDKHLEFAGGSYVIRREGIDK